MPKFLETTNKLLARQAINANYMVNAKDFGAVGDGVANDTTALQNWINHVVTNKQRGFLPNGQYKITSTLIVPNGYGWTLQGENRNYAALVQHTANIPILQIGVDGTGDTFSHTYTLDSLLFAYNSNQPSTNTNANCIVFKGGTVTTYWATFTNLEFSGGYYCYRLKDAAYGPWGSRWDMQGMRLMSGGFMAGAGQLGTQPNNTFGRMTLDCATSVGPILDGFNFYNSSIGAIEFLNALLSPQLMNNNGGGVELDIGSMKLEVGTYTQDQVLFAFNGNSRVRIGDLNIATVTLNAPNGVTAVTLGAGGSSGNLTINSLRCAADSATGKNLAVSTNLRLTVDHVELTGGWAFQDTASTETVNSAIVSGWVNGRVSDNRGNADTLIAVGEPNVQRFNTAFTTTRNIGLPNVSSNNLCAGLYYDLVFDGAINGANHAVIYTGGLTLRTQTVDKTKLRFVLQRPSSTGTPQWFLTEVIPLSPALRSVNTVTTSGGTLGSTANTDYVSFCNVSGDTAADKLVSLLHFNGANNSTTITDAALSPLTWTVNGNAKLSTAVKKFGTASLALDGAGDYLSLGASAAANFSGSAFCVEGWIYSANISSGLRGIFGQRADGGFGTWFLYQDQGVVKLQVANAALDGWDSDSTSGAVLSATTWHHVAVAGDATNIKVFVDGAQVINVSQPAWTSANRPLLIGSFGNPASGYQFNGYIDDVRVTKGAARYTSGFTAPTAEFPDQNTIVLPTAVSNTSGYTIKNISAAPIFVTTTSAQTIDGAATVTLTNGSLTRLLSDNANWRSV